MLEKNQTIGGGHVPVLTTEVLDALSVQPNENVLDGTVGAGGHASLMLEKIAPQGKLLGFDLDEVALDTARRMLERFGSRAMLVHANYKDVERMLLSLSFGPIQAVLLDLGFSSLEINNPARGFSFQNDGPLDMRFDTSQDRTAAEIVNQWPESDIAKILRQYGEERYAGRIARMICQRRRAQQIIGTLQLVDVIRQAVPLP